MQEFIIISIILILLFRTIRRFIFFNTKDAFQQAANQFYSKIEMEERKKKEDGTITIHPKTGKREDGEYVPYEEIK